MVPDQKVKILLVDDQPNNLLALEAVLAGEGLSLVRAHTGEQALLRVLDDDYAAILMDVQMPDLDGFETAELIRQRDRSKHTPILFLTAFQSTDAQIAGGTPSGPSTSCSSRSFRRSSGRRSRSSSSCSSRPSR